LIFNYAERVTTPSRNRIVVDVNLIVYLRVGEAATLGFVTQPLRRKASLGFPDDSLLFL